MITHLFMALGIVGMAAAIFALGFQSARIWMDWQDDRALRAAEARHAKRRPESRVERLADPTPFPGEPVAGVGYVQGQGWRFVGESEQGWAAESAEYELLTQTAEQPVSVTGEPPIDTGELLAITDRVEAWIAGWSAQGNYDRHTIQASDG